MAKTRRRRRLKGVRIDEVSFVDHPANLTPFLFVKSEEGIEKVFKSLDFEFSTNGTPEDTTLKINGRTIQKPQGISLWYMPIGDDSISLSTEYTVRSLGDDRDGFSSMKTYRLTKNEDGSFEETEEVDKTEPKQEDIDTIKSFLGEADDQMDGRIAKQLADSIKTIEEYKDDLPPVMVEAIQLVTKLATEMEVETITTEKEMSNEDTGTVVEPTTEPTEVTNAQVLEAITALGTRVEGVETKLAEKVETVVPVVEPVTPAIADEEEEISMEELGTMLATAVIEELKD